MINLTIGLQCTFKIGRKPAQMDYPIYLQYEILNSNEITVIISNQI